MAVDYRNKVVTSALSFVGVTGGKASGDDIFINYYNQLTGTTFDVDTTPWCAIFVTYNLRKAGIPTSICPSFAGCTYVRDKFLIPKNIYKLRTSGYIPKPGDLILFNWNKKADTLQHVGLVEKVEGSLIYTIEGNSKGGYTTYGVRHKSYDLNSPYIIGYGALKYEDITDAAEFKPTTSVATTVAKSTGKLSSSEKKTMIKKFQQWLNNNYQAGLVIDGSCGPLTKKAAIKALQIELNKQFNRGLEVDGSFGPLTKKVCETLKFGSKGNITYIAQGLLYAHGYECGGFDGSFGSKFYKAIKLYQVESGIKTLANYGKVDTTTWTNLCNKW